MRTTMDLDAGLINRLLKESGAQSKTQAIELAAQEYLKLLARQRLISRAGTLPDLADAYKASRRQDKKDQVALLKRGGRGR
jgi:hypothetical protein